MAQSSVTSLGPSIVATLRQIFEHQNEKACLEVLTAAHPAVVFLHNEGWNGEVTAYELLLAIPPVLFARIESKLGKIAERIDAKLSHLNVGSELEIVKSSRIRPQLLAGAGSGEAVAPAVADVARIWTAAGKVRMFMSHVSQHRGVGSKIKETLASLGISAFLAHEDIEPNLEWQKEVETALLSMDVLCALITPEFSKSRWTDQEIGFALGRNVPIVAVHLGLAPYGFIAKIQATPGSLSDPGGIASNVFDAALRIEPLRAKIIDALVDALVEAPSYLDARAGIKKLSPHQSALDNAQVERLLRAARDNSQVKEAFGVAKQIETIAKKAGVTLAAPEPQSELDDEIPF
jgi:hypothetical protein